MLYKEPPIYLENNQITDLLNGKLRQWAESKLRKPPKSQNKNGYSFISGLVFSCMMYGPNSIKIAYGNSHAIAERMPNGMLEFVYGHVSNEDEILQIAEAITKAYAHRFKSED